MKKLATLVLILSANSVFAGPRLSWDYYKKGPRGCWDECAKRVLGQCVQWRQRCDNRTVQFNDFHKRLIKSAMDKLSNRINTRSVSDCILRNRKKSYGVNPDTAHADYTAIRISSYLPKMQLHPYSENSTFSGRAYATRVVKNVRGQYLEWSGEPSMELNMVSMERMHNQHGFNAATDSLAGTIIHEFLHQMGHTHPHGYNDGNYVTVVGDCVASNGNAVRGSGGFGLTGGQYNYLFSHGPK